MEKKLEKLEDRMSNVHHDLAKDKEKLVSEYKEIVKEPQNFDDN